MDMSDVSTSPQPGADMASSANRACGNCARAKAKCMPQVGVYHDKRCIRCLRLQKDCVVEPRKARKRRSPNQATNVAHLEEKIESLVSLLGAHTALKQDIATGVGQPATPAIQNYPRPSTYQPSQPWGETGGNSGLQPEPRAQCFATSSSTAEANNPPPRKDLTIFPGEQADALFRVFRTEYALHFPFAFIPPDIDADQLHEKRPWVYRAIMLVANHNHRPRQVGMSKQFAMDVAEALILKGEKNVDILQGLLIHNAWSYYYSPVLPQAQSMILFQLTHAMVFDLGLNKPVRDNEVSDMLPDTSKLLPEDNPKEARRSLDERRTFLCCYFSTSVMSIHIRKVEVLQHTPYLDYCCNILDQARDRPLDEQLVALVRLQCIADSFQRSLTHKHESLSGDSAMLSWMYLKSMREELHSFWATLSDELRLNHLVLTTFYSAEVILFEPIVQAALPSRTFGMANAQRLDMLYSCMTAARRLLDAFIQQPVDFYIPFSLAQLAFIGTGLSTLFKISMYEEPGWDLVEARKTANLSQYFDELISKFEKAGSIVDMNQLEQCRMCFSTGCSRAMRRVKGLYESKIAGNTGQNITAPQDHPGLTGMEDVISGEEVDWVNDVYWQELMGDVNFSQF
ncbi:hypothetical protein BJ875DRAFT_441424 [Amylocarpus encephaloides]|uniref:Zn(2)-C6 fungal-type domain-containing protein n=1 Tax=Amylocarpus encephaloides TaxID=45428 RepID=A0A9P8C570_9HELO|nr:hypothetical protein BJ875DRAFT_441424 [Amylocarpus encephaloides]